MNRAVHILCNTQWEGRPNYTSSFGENGWIEPRRTNKKTRKKCWIRREAYSYDIYPNPLSRSEINVSSSSGLFKLSCAPRPVTRDLPCIDEGISSPPNSRSVGATSSRWAPSSLTRIELFGAAKMKPSNNERLQPSAHYYLAFRIVEWGFPSAYFQALLMSRNCKSVHSIVLSRCPSQNYKQTKSTSIPKVVQTAIKLARFTFCGCRGKYLDYIR